MVDNLCGLGLTAAEMKCSPQLKLTSEELESAVARLKVPLNRLHHDGMGGLVVGHERSVQSKNKNKMLSDLRASTELLIQSSVRRSCELHGNT